jgi:uncharacterized RDD family membrane protein YckC
MKNHLTISRLKIVSTVVAVIGLFLELFPLVAPSGMPTWIKGMLTWTKFADFVFFFYRNFFVDYNFNSGLVTNYFNVAFYCLMLMGAFLFWRKGSREIRLLRISYSLLLLVNVLYALNSIVGIITNPKALLTVYGFAFLFVYMKIAVVLYISWFGLKTLNGLREIGVEGIGDLGQTVKASRWHRFFHFVVDTILASVIFFPFFQTYAADFLQKIAEGMGERTAIFLMLLVSRMLYYPFYEFLFSATPAKFFSETRVVNRRKEAISLDQSIYRTLSRFAPFEAFSFLGDEDGWHDRWTDTTVVKEAREGVKGIRYLMIIPAALVLGAMGWTGYTLYEDHRREVYERNSHNEHVARLEEGLGRLSTNTIIHLERDGYHDVYLKPEEIINDDLYCSVYEPESSALSPYSAGEYYKRNQYSLNKVMINRKQLLETCPKEYGKEVISRKISLLQDDKSYVVKEVFDLDLPLIRSTGSGARGGSDLTLSIENCGWGGTLKEVRNISGSATFGAYAPLPMKLRPAGENSFNCAQFSLQSSNYEGGDRYMFQFTITDINGRDHVYEVDGVDMDRKVRKLK